MKCKIWKSILLLSVAMCVTTSREALADGGEVAGILNALFSPGIPIIDIASLPAHHHVIAAQELIREYSKEVGQKKMDIRKRLSVRKKEKKGSDGSGTTSTVKTGNDWYYYDLEDGVRKEKGEKVDGKLSKVKIETSCITDKLGGGVVGTGVDNIITTQGNTNSQDLVDNQQNRYISAAGTMETQAIYEQRRKYYEQEQAIQLIAYAATVRDNVNNMIGEVVDKIRANYEESDVKKDLDPDNKKEDVEKTNDYNQVLRQYAYYGLVYDQLLSLEQQIIGLRLQVKGADSEQKSNVLTDVLETEKGL